nr:PREDICTED: CASP-like protein 5A2 isoform X2 [Fragaria vesca subsp. vesca]
MPGTPASLALRLSQLLFSAAALAVVASTSDFPSVTAFCYLVAATGLQTLWSLSLAIPDVYALLVGRSLQSHKVVCLFTLGDGLMHAKSSECGYEMVRSCRGFFGHPKYNDTMGKGEKQS